MNREILGFALLAMFLFFVWIYVVADTSSGVFLARNITCAVNYTIEVRGQPVAVCEATQPLITSNKTLYSIANKYGLGAAGVTLINGKQIYIMQNATYKDYVLNHEICHVRQFQEGRGQDILMAELECYTWGYFGK